MVKWEWTHHTRELAAALWVGLLRVAGQLHLLEVHLERDIETFYNNAHHRLKYCLTKAANIQTQSDLQRPAWRWKCTLCGWSASAHPGSPRWPPRSLSAASPCCPSRSRPTCASLRQTASPRRRRSSAFGSRGGWCRRSPKSECRPGNAGLPAPVPAGCWPATGPRISWPFLWLS